MPTFLQKEQRSQYFNLEQSVERFRREQAWQAERIERPLEHAILEPTPVITFPGHYLLSSPQNEYVLLTSWTHNTGIISSISEELFFYTPQRNEEKDRAKLLKP